MGSTFTALLAGIRQAAIATIANATITNTNAFQSVGSTLNKTRFNNCAAARPLTNPAAAPANTRSWFSKYRYI